MKDTLLSKYNAEIDSFSTGHFNCIAKQVVFEVMENTSNINEIDQDTMCARIAEAIDFIIDLRDKAINRYAKFEDANIKPQDSKIFDVSNPMSTVYDDSDCVQVTNYWYVMRKYNLTAISMGDIETIISQYLNFDWSSQTIEWLIINAYVKQDLYEETEIFIKHHIELSRQVSLLIAGDNELLYNCMELFLYHFRVDYLIYILTPLAAIYYGLNLLGNDKVTAGITIILVTICLTLNLTLSLPTRIRKRNQFRSELSEKMEFKTYICALTWSPSVLMKKIESINQKKPFYPILIPLISKMIKRNPDVLNVKRWK